jgi:hypothetical protein
MYRPDLISRYKTSLRYVSRSSTSRCRATPTGWSMSTRSSRLPKARSKSLLKSTSAANCILFRMAKLTP